MYQDIVVTVEKRVGTVTINRVHASNALAKTTYGEIRQAVEALGKRPDVGAIVLTGAGKHFSAGGDIVRFRHLIETEQYLDATNLMDAGKMTHAIKVCSKPVIAMVNGVATGAGLSLALACDFRIVTPGSKLIMGFIHLGLPGDTGSIYFLARLLGTEKASRLMMTGEPVGGEEAVSIGLATKLAEEGALAAQTYAFAESLAARPGRAIALQKDILARYFYGNLDDYYLDETRNMAEASRGPDFREAVYAFLEKRPPMFNQGL